MRNIPFVIELTPAVLLSNAELVRTTAPWCVWLDNLELCCLLLTQPWLAGTGLRRADLERQLARLGADLPIGPVYFQRVNRAVATMEERGQLRGEGGGRDRHFVVTPEGFAALIINLQVLRLDPTVDGSEFELKRALVAMWNVVLERMLSWPVGVSLDAELEGFLDAVEELQVWGQRIVTEAVVSDALSVLRLTELQRGHVLEMLAAAEKQAERARARAELAHHAGSGPLGLARPIDGQVQGVGLQDVLVMVRSLATGVLPQLAAQANTLRYRAYLGYLETLARLYSCELDVLDLGALRRLASGRGR